MYLMNRQIKAIKEYMDIKGLNQSEMAEKLEITRQYFNLILNKNKNITPVIASRLVNIVGETQEYWMGHKKKNENDLVSKWISLGFRVLVDHEIEDAVDKKYIIIDPFNKKNLQSTSLKLTSYKIMLSHERKPILLNDDEIKIRKNQKVAILTRENIRIPKNISAVINPTTRIIDQSVDINSGVAVHPGYHGRLYFVLRNNTNKSILLKKDVKFIRIQFTFLPVSPRNTYHGRKQGMLDFPKEFVENFYEPEEDFFPGEDESLLKTFEGLQVQLGKAITHIKK